MGYAVLHLDKAHGADTKMSDHIERKNIPNNADPTRTHLNRELIVFPEGVENRNQAISQRLESAGLTRKIGINQVRVIRIVVSGSPEDMKKIEQAGRLDEWCRDNVDWLKQTYGNENIVSAVLHMDEKTPHIHATLIPIVRSERRKKKSEEQTTKKYRKKPTDAPRLSANDIMTRQRLKNYQDEYALAMSKYSLKRGIVGSDARHISTNQYYRDLLNQTEDIQEDISLLLEQREAAEQTLAKIKNEAKTEKLKNTATDTMTAIASGVGSLFGSGKLKELEQTNVMLHEEITKRDKGIEHLHKKIEQLQEQHSQQLQNVKETHQQELKAKDKEISQLGNIIAKAFKWFPMLKEMLRIEKFCRFIGFTQEMTDSLIIKKEALVCSGKIYSEEHKRKFEVKNETFKVEKDRDDDTKLVLTINGKPISNWFKEQFEKLRQSMHPTTQTQERSKGLRM